MKKVIVAMSGGIDSLIAAILLKEMGYLVHGIYFDLWKYSHNHKSKEIALQNIDDISKKFHLDWEIIDLRNEFKDSIIDYFLEGLKSGQTPNPCVKCNPIIKFHTLISYMNKMNFDFIATGHYAQIGFNKNNNTYEIYKALDRLKDQSYVLCLLTQSILNKILFPLGTIRKADVRKKAKELNLDFADQPESQDLCFVGNKDLYKLIMKYLPNSLIPGEIINLKNVVIGEHKGLAFYTIGQRKGIRVSSNKPYYVIRKDIKKNQLIVDELENLGKDAFVAENVNWISNEEIYAGKIVDVKIRYKATPEKATLKTLANNNVFVKFDRKIRDITPGQFAVFYENEKLLGGGMISEREK